MPDNYIITHNPVKYVTCGVNKCKGMLMIQTLSRIEEGLGHEGFKCDKCGRRVKYVPRTPSTARRMARREHSSLSTDQKRPSEATLRAEVPRWTRQGCILSLDGVEAIHVERIVDEHSNAKLSPVTCDAIADHVCTVLNTTDLDALTRAWMSKP